LPNDSVLYVHIKSAKNGAASILHPTLQLFAEDTMANQRGCLYCR